MIKSKFVLVVSFLFLIIGIVHAVRLLNGWEVQIADLVVPMWASWVAVLFAFYLALSGFRMLKRG
ncbi:MAG TPA: hypothetical protein VJC14_01135 [Candidatus Paceibacterota bacterium]